MSTFVLSLSDARATLEHAGGKGMSLAKLARAGLTVPDGFHITTEAYRQFIAANALQSKILETLRGVDSSSPVSLETASIAIAGLFAQGKIPLEITQAISEAYRALENSPAGIKNRLSVAVRSSATAEDLPESSFAGQQETFLNVCGVEAVLEAVRKCWASLWTARAIAYRARQGLSPDSVALAVVVQELVPAEGSGVMFTANPINGRRNEIMITAAWGLGEALVSGLVTPDTLVVDKSTGKMIRRDIAVKQIMTGRVDSGTRQVPVPDRLKKKPVLGRAQAGELAALGARIEKLYEAPMDIEWTRADGKFAIVQARPITALPEAPLEWPLPHPKAVLARGSFAEFVPEPVSPLFATLAVPIAREKSLELMSSIGMADKDSYLFSVINNYVYVGFIFTPRMIWAMTKATVVLFGPVIKNARLNATAARDKFLSLIQKWQSRDLEGMAPSELLAGVRQLFTETAIFYTMVQSGPIPASLTSEMAFAGFYTKLVKRKGEPDASKFLFGTENYAMRAEKALFDLAVWAREQPELADYLDHTPAEEICTALQTSPSPASGFGKFAARFEAYLCEFGHAIYDLDFSKPVPAEDPAPLLETLKVYLDGKNNPYERQRSALDLREEAAGRISKRLDPLRRKYFLKLLKWAQETAPLREDTIADLGLGHPQIRRMLGELGRRLTAGGAITCADDVYWLEAREVDDLAARLEKGEELKCSTAEVETRKARWQAMRHILPPSTLPKINWMKIFFPDNDQAGATIKGFGASAGKVTARACVMLGPEDFSKMQPGDVIVAGITTPAWTPLFARAAAIVTDIGGPLSHSSIVAREYGIPAVLATGVGTRRIQDGQTITVDGSAGTVSLLPA